MALADMGVHNDLAGVDDVPFLNGIRNGTWSLMACKIFSKDYININRNKQTYFFLVTWGEKKQNINK